MTASNKIQEQNPKFPKPYNIVWGIIPFALYSIS